MVCTRARGADVRRNDIIKIVAASAATWPLAARFQNRFSERKLERLTDVAIELAALLITSIFMSMVTAQSARADNEGIWALLKKPGYIVLLRHSYSPESPPDGDVKFGDCSTQRNLDDTGRAQARRLGDEFRKYGIKAASLVSSQYCRAMETAKLIKLGPVRALPALNQVFLTDVSGMRETGEKSRQFMKTIPARPLTVMVTHVTNIQSIAGANLSSGELAVLHLDASGSVIVDGRIKVS
jgi:phosphohistidine phosphatase SixA